MIKIAHIITSLNTGGAEIVLSNLIGRMDEHKYESIVISLSNIGTIGKNIQKSGVSVYSINMKSGRMSLKGFIQLIKILRESKVDIVQTWLIHSALLGGLASKISNYNTPIIWSLFQTNLDKDKNKWYTLLTIRICGLLSYILPVLIITDSQKAKEVHSNLGFHSRIFKNIPNGFDLETYKPNLASRVNILNELSLNQDNILVGLFARFDILKNHKGFIESTCFIKNEFHNVHFILVGSGIDKFNKTIKYWIKQTKNEDNFHLLGERKDIPTLMASLDILVSPSHGESFPLIVGEAMSCGVPCLVTDVGDCSWMVGDTGIVVKPGSNEELSKGLKKILDLCVEDRKILGFKARQRIEEKFTIKRNINEYGEIYEKLIDEKSYN